MTADDQDAELERLRREYPQWRIWRGRATGDYWALPPPGHPRVRELISAGDIGDLARRLAQARGSMTCELSAADTANRAIRDVTLRYLPSESPTYPIRPTCILR